MAKGIFLMVIGPSGSGKTTVVGRLLETLPSATRFITMTTRAPRPKEVPDVDYHFLTREEFVATRDRGELLEWAEVYGNFYGSSRTELEGLREKHSVVFQIVDVQGAKTLKGLIPDAVTVFLTAPIEQIRDRLGRRDGMPSSDVEKRLQIAKREYDLAPTFDHIVSCSDGRLEGAVTDIAAIIRMERKARS